MQALSSLVREHQLISGLLGALSSYAGRLRSALPPDAADFQSFASTFRELVDCGHHEKEESILLPLLARNGFAWSSGPLAEVRREHSHLRYLMDVVYQAAARELTWSRDERRKIADAITTFVEFKRRHLQKEEAELFPALSRRLEASALAQLEAELSQFDEATGRNRDTARLWQTAEQLIERYLVDSATFDLHRIDLQSVVLPSIEPRSAEARSPESGLISIDSIRRTG
jgi:hemerythrin-like domain-containing protein